MNGPLAIGIDLGGTQLRAALVDGEGAVLARTATLTDVAGGPAGVLAQMRQLVAEVSGSATGAVVSVGISSPGPLDTTAGVVLHIPTLPGWDGFPLRDRLAEELRLPVVLENDGIAAAYGEWRHGAGVGLSNLIYVTVSTSIGGGVVADGRVLRGRRGMAGHVGHFHMMPMGPRCACGALGCFAALAAGTALGQAARTAAEFAPESLLAAMAPLAELTAQHAVEAARRGDAVALEVIAQEADYLGRGFTSLIHLYSPDVVVMGGGVSAAFDLMSERIHRLIQQEAMAGFRDVRVVPAGLGFNSGLVGAAALALAQARERSGGNHDGNAARPQW